MAEIVKKATRESFGETVTALAAEYPEIVVLDADLAAATKTGIFKKAYPERFFDCGIAECNMVGVAAGLATCGKIPFAASFAMFSAGRAFEQVRNSVGYPKLNVKIVGSHAGISVGEDGATHQCCEDIALMRTIPGMVILNPCDITKCRPRFALLLSTRARAISASAVWLWKASTTTMITSSNLAKGITLREGTDITVVATGLMVQEAVKAADALKEEGISVEVINIHTIKPLDEELVIASAKKTGRVITVEEHNIIGGLGEAVSTALSEHCPTPVTRIGVNDVYGHSGLLWIC